MKFMKQYSLQWIGFACFAWSLSACTQGSSSVERSGGNAAGGSATPGVGGDGGHTDGKGSGGTSSSGSKTGGVTGGSGGVTGGSGGALATGGTPAVPCVPKLVGIVRDFTDMHPDFQGLDSPDCMKDPGACSSGMAGAVADTLDSDGRPVLKSASPVKDAYGYTIFHGAKDFAQWFRNTSGVNKSMQYEVMLVDRSTTLKAFGGDPFFPIDAMLYGNADLVKNPPVDPILQKGDADHNQLFTFELHAEVLYEADKNQIIISESDDDSWVFINGKLAIDNGGMHGLNPVSVTLKEVAATLQLESGKSYPIVFFFADRKLTGASFRVSSNAKFTNCDPILPKTL